MSNNFTISEVCIEDKPIPLHVADKIVKHHFPIIQRIRDEIGLPISASENSGYRSSEYELSKYRSGNSEHCFLSRGAIDWTCEDIAELVRLLRLSKYKRVCYYPENRFVHCDFAGDEYLFFINTILPNGKWGWVRQCNRIPSQ